MQNLKQHALVTAFAFGLIAVAGTVAAQPDQNPVVSVVPTPMVSIAPERPVVVTPALAPSPRPTAPVVHPTAPVVRPRAVVVTPTPKPTVPAQAVISVPASVDLPSPAEAAPKKKSGLEGMMLIDGGCPVLEIRRDNPEPDPNCAPKPFPSTVSIYNTDTNTFVTELTAKPNGKYKIDLEPGNYLITTNIDYFSRPTMPWLPPVTVHVSEGGYTECNIMFDSGIVNLLCSGWSFGGWRWVLQ